MDTIEKQRQGFSPEDESVLWRIAQKTTMRLIYKILLLCNSIFYAGIAAADDIQFTTQVSRTTVATGETFKITFTVNASGKNFHPPDFSGFKVISGPNQSSSMQIINGDISQSISWSYYLIAEKEGKFTIGAATVSAGGKSYSSGPVEITVVKGNAPQAQSPPNQHVQQGQPKQQNPAESQSATADKLFLAGQVSDDKVYQGEQLIVTYKIYFRVNIVDNRPVKLPELNGFWTEDLKMPQQAQVYSEVVNGVKFNVADLKKAVLFPQRSGTLEIDPMEFECVVRYQRQPTSFWDWPFSSYQDVKHTLKSKPIKITVLPLPSPGKPGDFNGAVGNFSMSATIDKPNVRTNEAVTLKVTYSGRGNLKLVDKPNIFIPPDIESYDPKVTDKTSVTGGGVSGSKSYEYLLIPRHAGDFRIDPFSFSYFDPEKKSYITLRSPEFLLHVEKGADLPQVAYSPVIKEDIQLIGSDIRFIKHEMGNQSILKNFIFLSIPHVGLTVSPFILFFLFLFLRRRQEKLNRDVVKRKQRRALSVAKRRLNGVKKYLHDDNHDKFYDELLKAIWDYAGDKMNMPRSELSKENIISGLTARSVPEDVIHKFISLLDTCEFSRYAPAGASKDLQETLADATDIIREIEEKYL